MTEILLARHGETDWNRERRWQGHADPPLNAAGRRQAARLADALAADPPTAVYTSDLARARETAEIVAARLGLPVAADPRLREVDVGEWSGLTAAEAEERYPEGMRRRLAGGTGWEHGESYETMTIRVVEALRSVAAAHDGDRVLVITHGGPMGRVWLECGLDPAARPRVANCGVHRIEIEGATIRGLD
ncbi:MAG TPA: histidine phosphatase family protein [Gaiellaceae bacterium]|nr:histidine phosphatase family protein [Gaiellaceae bacterium]